MKMIPHWRYSKKKLKSRRKRRRERRNLQPQVPKPNTNCISKRCRISTKHSLAINDRRILTNLLINGRIRLRYCRGCHICQPRLWMFLKSGMLRMTRQLYKTQTDSLKQHCRSALNSSRFKRLYNRKIDQFLTHINSRHATRFRYKSKLSLMKTMMMH